MGSIKTDDCLNRQTFVTRFFQTKAFPPSLWNACDYMLQFNFEIAHITGSVNTASDFFSRLELKVTEKIHLKIREDVQTTPTEVTTSTSDVANEEQFFFTQAEGENEIKEQIFQRKRQSRKKSNRLGSKSRTILNKTKNQRVHKDRRKHYVVVHKWNQGKCTNTSRARCRSRAEKCKTQNTSPTTRRCANDNRQTIQALQSKRRKH